MTSPRCLVRGSINIDEFFHLPHIVRPGETISSTRLTKKAGGKGANQAYALARAGGGVVLDGCIGDDGVWVRGMLEGVGVDVGRLRVVENEVTGRAIIQSAADGENSIVLHAGANYHIPASDTPPQLSGFTHLLLQNEIPLSSTLSYLTAASSLGVISTFNPSPMLTPGQLRSFPWQSLSWLIVNEGELGDLLQAFEIPLSSSPDLRTKAEEELLALHKSKSFHPDVSIICTLGAQGILYFQPGQAVGHLPAATLLHPLKDTTGAGDCFAGYFVAGLMRGLELEQVLTTCLTACAMCVESAGAMESVPALDEVKQRMA
ncbi:hypothetical protein JCM24511_07757 [Saitozyma sp. JCM 24511]|nr:hypothetical protein JCM24511_07757 [Saitozyma sp. JCM 24511]